MEKPLVPEPFSPDDMARRRKRSIAIALILLAMAVLFFITTLVRLGSSIADRTI
jgi:hypothetical protein